jgi:hypothetical protein
MSDSVIHEEVAIHSNANQYMMNDKLPHKNSEYADKQSTVRNRNTVAGSGSAIVFDQDQARRQMGSEIKHHPK